MYNPTDWARYLKKTAFIFLQYLEILFISILSVSVTVMVMVS